MQARQPKTFLHGQLTIEEVKSHEQGIWRSPLNLVGLYLSTNQTKKDVQTKPNTRESKGAKPPLMVSEANQPSARARNEGP